MLLRSKFISMLWAATLPIAPAQTSKATEAEARPVSAAPAAAGPRSRAVSIGPDDTVTVVAVGAEEISKAWRVGNTGYLNLPMVGRIYAAGMSVEQLEAELLDRLKKYIIDPQVVVYVSEYRSEPVTVVGAVEKPGITQIQGAHGLFEVLMLAGGPRNAGNSVTVTRAVSRGRIAHPAAVEQDGSSVVVLKLGDVMEGRGIAANLPIQAGDVISVSDLKEQKLVYVVGEVNKPGAVELITREEISLLRILAVAGGMTRVAAPGSAFIRHTDTRPGEPETTEVNVKRILSGKAKDVILSPGDILIVPSSRLKGMMQTASQSMLTTGIMVLARF